MKHLIYIIFLSVAVLLYTLTHHITDTQISLTIDMVIVTIVIGVLGLWWMETDTLNKK